MNLEFNDFNTCFYLLPYVTLGRNPEWTGHYSRGFVPEAVNESYRKPLTPQRRAHSGKSKESVVMRTQYNLVFKISTL